MDERPPDLVGILERHGLKTTGGNERAALAEFRCRRILSLLEIAQQHQQDELMDEALALLADMTNLPSPSDQKLIERRQDVICAALKAFQSRFLNEGKKRLGHVLAVFYDPRRNTPDVPALKRFVQKVASLLPSNVSQQEPIEAAAALLVVSGERAEGRVRPGWDALIEELSNVSSILSGSDGEQKP
jgi:hypothetical protein